MSFTHLSRLSSENTFLKLLIVILFLSNFSAYYLIHRAFQKEPIVIRVDRTGKASALAISYRQMQRQDEREIKAFSYEVFTHLLDISPGSYEKNVAWVANHMTPRFKQEYLKVVQKQVAQIKQANFFCEIKLVEEDLKILSDSSSGIEIQLRAVRVIVDPITQMKRAEAIISKARLVRTERTIENPYGLLLEDSVNEKFVPIDIGSDS